MNKARIVHERIAYMFTALIFGVVVCIGFLGFWIRSIVWFEYIRHDWPYSENKLAIRLYRLVTTNTAIGAILLGLLLIIGLIRFLRYKFAMIILMFIFMLLFITSLLCHSVTVAWTQGNNCQRIKDRGLDKGKSREDYIEWSKLFDRTEKSIWNNQCPKSAEISLAFLCVEMVGLLLLLIVTYPLAYHVISVMIE
ncbi:hypothetical protein TVAG_314020 [Trichomonas vaginalis G3]|uniref:Uncharacterized protein n=1 Tax=Trichomonas vaginalis (strain ATCC PRA-98 / G3) TaxID=412133 RepID=A2EKK0_TRIV3|nr:hypothetical protein TVAGG3_0412330 [Trichomonas vaginalis G3]EAY06827.1 hypothetical protein TVAG_314020 [Trichomonas vaginalis G3]KAI5535443.1 hypothetical protein TVAGG3_0412330 [Trichomonas vaginalis G3]|eukprot:XP_001319050.1 hypothetical protein [Trichomonas vaginalis G3]